MKAKGYGTIKMKNGKFPHSEQNHDDKMCEKCGAIFCAVSEWCKWQQFSFLPWEDSNLPLGICRVCQKSEVTICPRNEN